MASMSLDIATTFIGLAKLQTRSLCKVRTTPVSPLLWKAKAYSFRSSHSMSVQPRIYSVDLLRPNRFSRRFSVAAAATAPETDSSDLTTKIPPDNRIPATIITGFLGSGKVCLNAVSWDWDFEDVWLWGGTIDDIVEPYIDGKRIAVIENEYGEVDIDGSLVAAKAVGAEDIVMLNNGCLCCTVRGDLVRMIADLVNKKKGKFDHIIIETTGLANPSPIIQTFYAEDQVFNDVKLDGVVTLVDAKHAGFHLDDVKPKGVVNEAIEQIAYADRIIVNKTDLVSDSQVTSLIQRIRGINSMANLKRTQFGSVDLDYVLGIGGFDLERIEAAVDVKGAEEDHASDNYDHDHDHEHHHDHENEHHHDHDHKHEHHHDHHALDHVHDPGVSSISIVCEGSLDLEKANMWLGNLLMDRSDDIYRMKGILSVDGMDERFVFQGVHDIFQGSPDRLWRSDEQKVNKIVFIGKNLDKEEIEKRIQGLLIVITTA